MSTHCVFSVTLEALGRWVTSQRADYKNGTMDEEYERMLRRIGFVWDRYEKVPTPTKKMGKSKASGMKKG